MPSESADVPVQAPAGARARCSFGKNCNFGMVKDGRYKRWKKGGGIVCLACYNYMYHRRDSKQAPNVNEDMEEIEIEPQACCSFGLGRSRDH